MEFDVEKLKGKTLSCVPLSYNAFLLADLIKTSAHDILYVASNGGELEQIAEVLSFLAPKVEILKFPAWDTTPYDRTSPNISIMGQRLEMLSKLAFEPNALNPRIIVASVGSVLQKLPPMGKRTK